MARLAPGLLATDSGFYIAAVIVVSGLLVFGVTVPVDKLRKQFGERSDAALGPC
jgi:hypothetical protein